MKPGPPFVVDYMITFQLLQLEELWDALPALAAELRPAAEEAKAKALRHAMGETCGGCGSIRDIVTPVHNRLWGHVALLRAAEPTAAEPVAALVAAKRGYRPTPIRVYYRGDDGQTHVLDL